MALVRRNSSVWDNFPIRSILQRLTGKPLESGRADVDKFVGNICAIIRDSMSAMGGRPVGMPNDCGVWSSCVAKEVGATPTRYAQRVFSAPRRSIICIGSGGTHIDLPYRNGHFPTLWLSRSHYYVRGRNCSAGETGAALIGGADGFRDTAHAGKGGMPSAPQYTRVRIMRKVYGRDARGKAWRD